MDYHLEICGQCEKEYYCPCGQPESLHDICESCAVIDDLVADSESEGL